MRPAQLIKYNNGQDRAKSLPKSYYTYPGLRMSINQRRDTTMHKVVDLTELAAHGGASEDLFAEKFLKVTFRDYSNNTRMDIKNVDLKN